MKDPNVVTPALSDEEVMEMFQKEHENPGYVDDEEVMKMNQLEYERKTLKEEQEIKMVELDLTEYD